MEIFSGRIVKNEVTVNQVIVSAGVHTMTKIVAVAYLGFHKGRPNFLKKMIFFAKAFSKAFTAFLPWPNGSP